MKWKPKNNEHYYYVTEKCKVGEYIWDDDEIDKRMFRIGNLFRTRAEAEMVKKEIGKMLKGRG